MKKIKEFLNRKIHINIIDAIGLTTFTFVLQISSLAKLQLDFKYFILISIFLWIFVRVVFMIYIFNRDNRN